VDTLDAGKGPCAKCVKEGNVGVNAEDVREAPRVEVLAEVSCCSLRRYQQRYVGSVDVGDVREAPLAVGVKG